MENSRAVLARKSAVSDFAPSAMPGTFMLKPVANISGSSTSERGSGPADSINWRAEAKLRFLSSQMMSVWQQYTFIIQLRFLHGIPAGLGARDAREEAPPWRAGPVRPVRTRVNVG